jgi:hypothetical protein
LEAHVVCRCENGTRLPRFGRLVPVFERHRATPPRCYELSVFKGNQKESMLRRNGQVRQDLLLRLLCSLRRGLPVRLCPSCITVNGSCVCHISSQALGRVMLCCVPWRAVDGREQFPSIVPSPKELEELRRLFRCSRENYSQSISHAMCVSFRPFSIRLPRRSVTQRCPAVSVGVCCHPSVWLSIANLHEMWYII